MHLTHIHRCGALSESAGTSKYNSSCVPDQVLAENITEYLMPGETETEVEIAEGQYVTLQEGEHIYQASRSHHTGIVVKVKPDFRRLV